MPSSRIQVNVMLMIEISDVKNLMQKLLFEKENAFDAFLLSEATIKMDASYVIDGHINKNFYSDEEAAELERLAAAKNQHFDPRMIRWGQIKSHVLSIISGKKTPLSFNIVFYLSNENTDKFLSKLEISDQSVRPDGLMLRLNYDNNILTATTGTVFNNFTLDRTIDNAWDDMVRKFFTSISINFEER